MARPVGRVDQINCTSLISSGAAGFRGLFSNPYVALCAAFSAMGGLLFGYECVHTFLG